MSSSPSFCPAYCQAYREAAPAWLINFHDWLRNHPMMQAASTLLAGPPVGSAAAPMLRATGQQLFAKGVFPFAGPGRVLPRPGGAEMPSVDISFLGGWLDLLASRSPVARAIVESYRHQTWMPADKFFTVIREARGPFWMADKSVMRMLDDIHFGFRGIKSWGESTLSWLGRAAGTAP